MAYGRVGATAVAALLLTSGAARAGFDAGVLIQKSPQLEQTVSHILVGRLVAYHQAKSAPGRYVAEVEVSGVEKGEGISPGARIYVHFSSPRTLAQIKTERVVPDCGDRKIDPLPGEWMRVYTQLNDDDEYVADHPDCFFYTGRKPPEDASISPPRPDRLDPRPPRPHRGLLRLGRPTGPDTPAGVGSGLNRWCPARRMPFMIPGVSRIGT